jgi:imidazolonepropionase-like amidohydrolase
VSIALEHARIFSAVGDDAPIDDGTIVVDRGEIIWVGAKDGRDRPPSDRAVDCSGLVITPGLIDAHVHLIYNGVRDAYTIELARPLEEATIDAALHAKRLLELGITAIRDVGTRGNIAVVIRDAINAGRLTGPRVKASKQIISVFGAGDIHPTHVFGRTPYRDALTEIISGPWQARDAVRLQVKDGVDWIKAEASGTGFNPFCPADVDTMSFEELHALCEEASEKERPVACHAESRRSIIKAAKAGCRTVEHAIYLDEEGTQALLDHDVAVCPTLGLYTAFVEKGLASGVPPAIVANHRRTHELHVEAINSAFKAGVTIVAGSDSGLANFPQGGGLEEICGFVDVVGMSPTQALVSATRDAARVIGFGDAGTVEIGKRADLVLYRHDPTIDIRVITDDAARVCVLQGGAVVSGALP